MINFDFTGRSILVTGAATGMGLAEATLLLRAGAKVWMADIRTDVLEEAAASISSKPGDVHTLHLDVTDPTSWQAAVSTIQKLDGRLEGLVNNAGRSLRKSLVETTDSDWRAVMAVNLDSVFYGMKYCHPLLAEGDGASVVNVSSITGMLGYFAPAYGTSKWGVRGLSHCAALEFSSEEIRVNSIHPGLVESPLLNSGSTAFVEESVKSIPLNRVAEPDEIAQVVAFLLDPASSYMTGTEVVIDGGLTSGGTYKQITERISVY